MNAKELQKRKRRIWLIGATAFAIIGIVAFVVGYGLKDGWASVLAWFTSKWATYLYIGLALYAFVVFMGYKAFKVEEMTK